MTTLLNLESVSCLFEQQIVNNDMRNNNLTKTSADIQAYTPPVCEVILEEIQSIICASGGDPNQGTEIVDEIDGEW